MLLLEKTKGNIKAAHELEVLLDLEETISNLETIKQTRELNNDETLTYNTSLKNLETAKQMIEVPDNAIQIDIFTNDTKTNSFTKTAFYTKSEELRDSHIN